MGPHWWLGELGLAEHIHAQGQEVRQLWDNQALPDVHLPYLGQRSGSLQRQAK